MRFIHENLKPLMATLIVLAVIIAWFGTPAPSPSSSAPQGTEPWTLPKLAEYDIARTLDTINGRNLWGDQVAESAKAPTWHIVGVAMSANGRFMLLSFEDKPIEMLKVGDVMPDGGKILQIKKDRYSVLTPDNKKLTIGINKYDQAK